MVKNFLTKTMTPERRPNGQKIVVLYGKFRVQIRALASARGSVAQRALKLLTQPPEGPKGPRVAETRESEGPKGTRTSKAECPSWRLTVLLYVFHNSAQNRDFHGRIKVP